MALVVLALLLSATFMGHGLLTGIAVPYPDPTPEQAASVRHYHAISTPLFIAAGLSWMLAAVVTGVWLIRWAVKRPNRPIHPPVIK